MLFSLFFKTNKKIVKVPTRLDAGKKGKNKGQEVPQFEFLDSPLNQQDLDSHVPVDGYGRILFFRHQTQD